MLSAYLQLHFIVLIWGFTAILGRLINLSPVEIVLYRTLIAVIGIYFLLKLKGMPVNLNRNDALPILGTGILIALHWVTFFLAARVSNISICLAGLATTSFWTSMIDPLINKRRIKFYEPLLGLFSVVGIVIVFNASIDSYVGLVIAIISAILSALFTVINGRLIKKQNHYTITYYEMIGAFLTTVVLLPFYQLIYADQPFRWITNGMDIFYLLILGLICTVYAYSVGVKIMHKLSAFTINLTINLEPVYGIIMAVLLFSSEEKMGSNFYIGTSIIMISVLLYPLVRKIFHDRYLDTDVLN
ncbi:MAG: EamA family transporter [Reichenbachiella sp.]